MRLHRSLVVLCIGGLAVLLASVQTADAGSVLRVFQLEVGPFLERLTPSGTRNPQGIAWDGTNYWTVMGGGTDGNRLARYESDGTLVGSFALSPAMDPLSVFTVGTDVYIYPRQSTTTGAPWYAYKVVDKNAGTIATDTQINFRAELTNAEDRALRGTGILWDASSETYIAHGPATFVSPELWTIGHYVWQWDSKGKRVPGPTGSSDPTPLAIELLGYPAMGTNEGRVPQSRVIAGGPGLWFTLSDSTLSAWAPKAGLPMTYERVDTLDIPSGLVGSYSSLSYANSLMWFVDYEGKWCGYQVIPEPVTMLAVGLGIAGLVRYGRRRLRTA